MKRAVNQKHRIGQPTSLPFIDSIMRRFNIRVDKNNEQVLLATYERYWAVRSALADISGQEKRFLKQLASKHQSFIGRYI